MSILCGTDLSSETHDAIRVAAALAHRWNEPLQLIHAIDAPFSVRWDTDLRAHAHDAAVRRLHTEAEHAREQGASSVETSVDEGAPDTIIVSKGASRSTRLIVVGAVGERTEPARRTGRTAERIAASAKSPVLVVRSASPIKAWLRGERSIKIVVGDDLTPVSTAALRWTAELRRLGPCEIVVGHVYSLFDEKSRLGIGGSLNARLSELEQASLAALRRHASPSIGAEGVNYRVEGTLGRAAEPLLDIAADEAADLVVVGTAQRTGFGRAWHGWTSQIVLNDAPCSVVCVPTRETPSAEPRAVPPLRRVLVTTDFSSIADQAVAYAYAIVADGGTVHLLHVDEQAQPESQSATTERLRRLIPESASRRKIESRLEVVSDRNVPAAVTAAAERHDVDVVCMGTHGRTFLPFVTLGSVARAVAERCRRQLLLVPPLRGES